MTSVAGRPHHLDRANWGRWGQDDERGCLNHVGPEQVARATACVQRGVVYSLAHVIGSSSSPVLGDRRAAIQHHMLRDGGDPPYSRARDDFIYAEDFLGLPVHSATTHIDAVGHGWSEGLLFNGYPSSTVDSRGVRHCGIDSMGPVVTRGLLFDIAALEGVEQLPDDFAITADHLDRASQRTGPVEPGDAVLIRTAWARRRTGDGPNDLVLEHPGLVGSAAEWLHDHDVCLVGSDTLAVELMPSPSGSFSPLHTTFLRDLGMPLVELLDLEALAVDDVSRFCLIIAPLRIQGGTGSPVCPVAVA